MSENVKRKGEYALLLAMAAGKTVRDAAKDAAINERTATRRLADPVFRWRVAELRRELLECAAGRLANSSSEAADTLRELLASPSDQVRLGACRAILEIGARLRETVELEERIAALESQAAGVIAP